MPLVDLICLANSNKMGGRCIAGLRTDGNGGVRPIASDTDHGQLYFRHFKLDDGTEPKVLDVIRVDLARPAPAPGQPENWILGAAPWKLRRRPAGEDLVPRINTAITTNRVLLGSLQARVPVTAASGLESSLALVLPSSPRWYINPDRDDRLQPRVIFELDRQRYDLPVTDPLWIPRIIRKLSQAEPRSSAQEKIGISKDSKVLFTVSLSEPFNGYCYKLAAAMVVMPRP
jgi:putative nucleic acid modification protein with dual OB domain